MLHYVCSGHFFTIIKSNKDEVLWFLLTSQFIIILCMPFQALVELVKNGISLNSLAFSPFSVNSLFPKMYNMQQFLLWLNNLILNFSSYYKHSLFPHNMNVIDMTEKYLRSDHSNKIPRINTESYPSSCSSLKCFFFP